MEGEDIAEEEKLDKKRFGSIIRFAKARKSFPGSVEEGIEDFAGRVEDVILVTQS